MKVSKEEILHIADLASLNLEEEKVDSYLKSLDEILNLANIVNDTNVENLEITIGNNQAENIFRKDEVKNFEDVESLMKNAPEKSQNMFKIPKIL